jgi:hypothetical protein
MFGDDIDDVPGMDMADRFKRLAVENADDVAKLFDDPDSIINPSVHGFFQAQGVAADSTCAALSEVLARGNLLNAIIDARGADRGAGLEFEVRGHEYAAIASSLSGSNLGHVMPVCADG